MFNLVLIVLLSYLVGSIPTSIIVGKLVKGIDIRNYGSGNPGGTNVIRVVGLGWGIFVILFDAFKGYFATAFIAKWFYNQFLASMLNLTTVQIIAGCFAVVGHMWTVFAGFKGGKGVSTSAGMLLGIAPLDLLIAFLIFALIVSITRYVSLGSIVSAILFPFIIIFSENFLKIQHRDFKTLLIFGSIIAFLIVYRHRSNIKRLIAGNENKLSFGKK
ncbi:glycerol-3-phosphate 1-O-acyltransferase PlsY [Candidatus Chrysopegis kryptomonas]|uniref:Glycerol-3-phosphate acyltransferase n=1 Tax=Candidatus Chryseopegocella kryptomonas TaxID=1633643 RepID=A0A0N7MYJ5_9BACT|nr:glycerol-3-phosphate 1-O-acyltransferase PlsY [Candidatus Chrysopegis kryptomonas]CUT04419.1 acyl-phosphate glycerol-3-phosphate acyltransferase [Candidatus Chrysopegis kryptomonas]